MKLYGNESFEDEDDCYENPSLTLRGVPNLNTSANKVSTSLLLTENQDTIIYADSQYDQMDAIVINQAAREDLVIGTALVIYAFAGTYLINKIIKIQ